MMAGYPRPARLNHNCVKTVTSLFFNPMHICSEKSGGDENRKIPCEKISEDILELQACSDIVSSDLLSDHEKQQALSKNCICLMQIVPLNYDLAKFCFSRNKFFLVKKDNPSLSFEPTSDQYF